MGAELKNFAHDGLLLDVAMVLISQVNVSVKNKEKISLFKLEGNNCKSEK